MFSLNSALSIFWNKKSGIEKSQNHSNKINNQKYFLTGTSDSDKIVRSFLSREDQLKWRLFSRHINEMLDPITVISGRMYICGEHKYSHVTSFMISPCGQYLLLGLINSSNDTSVLKILNFNTRAVVKEIVIKRTDGIREGISNIRINSIMMNPCGKKIVVHAGDGSDGMISVWNFSTGENLFQCLGVNVVLSPCGSKIVSKGYSILTILDANTGEKLSEFGNGYSVSSISSFAISFCGTKIIVAFTSGMVKILDFVTGELCGSFFYEKASIRSIIMSPCGTKFLTLACNGIVKIFDLNTAVEFYRLDEEANIIRSLAVTPCGTKLVTGLANGFIKIWDFMTGSELRKFFVYSGPIVFLQISSCGKKIIILTDQRNIQTWDIEEKDFSSDNSAFINWKRQLNASSDCLIQ